MSFFAAAKTLLSSVFWRGSSKPSADSDYDHPTYPSAPPAPPSSRGRRGAGSTVSSARGGDDDVGKPPRAAINRGRRDAKAVGTRSRQQAPSLASLSSDARDPRSVAPLPRKSEYSTGSPQSWSSATLLSSFSPFSSSTTAPTSSSSSSSSSASTARPPPAPPAAGGGGSKNGELCCDKCDGKHETDSCPYFKKPREDHIDAKKNGWKLVGGTSNLPGAVLRTARIVPQPGDGSMSYGLKDGSSATSLRREICDFIRANPSTPICETPLSDWVKWDSGTSCADYARKMSRGCWGGGIEMACASRLKGCNVHVYERDGRTGGFKRISAFDHPIKPDTRKIVRVLYRGGVHYDALVSD